MRWGKKRHRYRVEGIIETAGEGETMLDIYSPVVFATKPDFSFTGAGTVVVSQWLTRRRGVVGAKLAIISKGNARISWRLEGKGYPT